MWEYAWSTPPHRHRGRLYAPDNRLVSYTQIPVWKPLQLPDGSTATAIKILTPTLVQCLHAHSLPFGYPATEAALLLGWRP